MKDLSFKKLRRMLKFCCTQRNRQKDRAKHMTRAGIKMIVLRFHRSFQHGCHLCNVQYNLYSETTRGKVIKVVSYSRWSLNAGSIQLIEEVASEHRSLKAVDCLIQVVSNTGLLVYER